VSLSVAEVAHVARLARLALSDAEIEALAPQLSAILDYAEQVAEVAAADVEPTTHPFGLADVLREDEPRPSLPRDTTLAGAPRVDGEPQVEQDRFVVPRIVAEEG
jgi:aspartyl-tRNA(Asn)/glutamyl-tRNA(Gln) amidotransferase subunit C